MRSKLVAMMLFCVFIIAAPTLAHHSYGGFDATKWVTLRGKVMEYHWENPHARVIITVPKDPSNPSLEGTWWVEGASVNIMERQGWNKLSFKTGDPIVAVVHPLKSGTKGASFGYVIRPDNTRMWMNDSRSDGPPGDTSKNPD